MHDGPKPEPMDDRPSCEEMIDDARSYAEGMVCSADGERLVCPHGDVVYVALNGCEVSYLQSHGWTMTDDSIGGDAYGGSEGDGGVGGADGENGITARHLGVAGLLLGAGYLAADRFS